MFGHGGNFFLGLCRDKHHIFAVSNLSLIVFIQAVHSKCLFAYIVCLFSIVVIDILLLF